MAISLDELAGWDGLSLRNESLSLPAGGNMRQTSLSAAQAPRTTLEAACTLAYKAIYEFKRVSRPDCQMVCYSIFSPDNPRMALYIVLLLTFLAHLGFAGSRVAVALFAVDQGATPFIVGTVVSLYA